jgi:hypothetical protein
MRRRDYETMIHVLTISKNGVEAEWVCGGYLKVGSK